MLILIGTVVLAALVLPLLARSRVRSSRPSCINHIKQVGLSFRMFANDHEDKLPWQVATNDGGSLEWAPSSQVFRHFAAASNELNTPKILRCPVDSRRSAEPNWQNLNNSKLSYFVGLDANEGNASLILTGDRHITGGTMSNGFLRTLTQKSGASWTRELHDGSGNLGFADGSVQQVNSADLQSIIRSNTLTVIRLAVP